MLSTILWKLLFIALGIAVIIAIIVIYFYKTSQSIKYERRITDFALSSVSDSELSLFDRLTKWLGKLVHNLGSAFAKLKIFKKSIKKYEKYKSINPQYIASDYLGIKLLVALILMILNIITKLLL